MSNWKTYENQVVDFLKSIYPGCRVESNVMLSGLRSGSRQVDAVIHFEIGMQKSFAIVNAKNYGRKVDKGKVDELIANMDDLGAALGLIISTSGFTKGAKDYAKNTNRIELLQFQENKSSLQYAYFPILFIRYGIELSIDLKFDKGRASEEDYANVTGNQLIINDKSWLILEYFEHMWNSGLISKLPGNHTFEIDKGGKFVINTVTKDWIFDLKSFSYIWTAHRSCKLVKMPINKLFDVKQGETAKHWYLTKFNLIEEYNNPKYPFVKFVDQMTYDRHKNLMQIEIPSYYITTDSYGEKNLDPRWITDGNFTRLE